MKYPQASTTDDIDRWGQAFAARLDLVTMDMGHDISERLRIARQRAIQARPATVRQLRHAASTQANGTLTAPTEDGQSLWRILASALPLVVLVLGLMLIQSIQLDTAESDIASIDSALLLDELPPDAYTDPGFVQFLKLQLTQRPANE
ncbi:hypothetical protein B9Z47_07320 [Limnohabitans sp. 2KL-1]|uniref:DUF3619 family protein n=1 Tax=Limnohabitans sp. 2KL-1 TaxID=1100699 RepID=UPI000D3C7979|nr:DUF3619 family protein [Limnohabitans sp. 2KL-1]PUE49279.1 hypothetical protein B9Z47_07320 [Limnohabitans sp. 2KL-1]